MKVLITGAAGYIGSMLSYYLIYKGYKVIGVDKLMYGGKSLLGLKNNENYNLIVDDIANTDSYEKYIDEETAIINLAAIVGEPASKKFPEDTKETNVVSTKKLIDLAKEKKVKKFIFVSTCSNYGMVESGDYADENAVLKPLSLYAETKVEIEKYLINQIKSTLNWTILRLATVYGISPRLRFDLTVNDFTMTAFKDKKLEVFLPYSNRPYVHVFDVARAMETVLSNLEKTKSEIYNVGDTKENYQKVQIVDEVKKLIPDLQVEFVNKGNDLRDYRVNFDKIKNELGFNITNTVPDGVNEVYQTIKSGVVKDFDNREYYNAWNK